MMPPAVIASDVAISTIVRFAVRTFGSRMMRTPFETASMPGVRAAAERVRADEEQRARRRTPSDADGVPVVHGRLRARPRPTSPMWPPMATTRRMTWVSDEDGEDRQDGLRPTPSRRGCSG